MAALIASAVLFLGSAALQLAASLQRWVVFRRGRPPDEFAAEDHAYDYFIPTDPWESIGNAAILFGAATLVQACGVVSLAAGVALLPRTPGKKNGAAMAGGCVAAVLLAAWFTVQGIHALASGVDGVPSSLQFAIYLWAPISLAPIAMAVLWAGKSAAASAASLFLLGSTFVGYFAANFILAPLVAGYTSHDTTPWMETVLAASTAGAAVALIFAARTVWRRGATPSAPGS